MKKNWKRIVAALAAAATVCTAGIAGTKTPYRILSVSAVESMEIDGVKLSYEVEMDGEVTITGCSQDAAGKLEIPTKIQGCDVTAIGDKVFENCTALTEVVIGEGVLVIGSMAFSGCTGLTSVELPDSVINIGALSFTGCSSLTTIKIGSNLQMVNMAAFENCTSLADVYYNGTQAQWDNILISDFNEALINAKLHCKEPEKETEVSVPDGSTQSEWKRGDCNHDGKITIEDAYQTLMAYAKTSAGLDSGLTEQQKEAVDVDEDGKITIQDAYKILLYYATASAGGTPSWE